MLKYTGKWEARGFSSVVFCFFKRLMFLLHLQIEKIRTAETIAAVGVKDLLVNRNYKFILKSPKLSHPSEDQKENQKKK